MTNGMSHGTVPSVTVTLRGGPRHGEVTTAHPDATADARTGGAYRCLGFSGGVWLYQWHATTTQAGQPVR
jgi:hypothetical protein